MHHSICPPSRPPCFPDQEGILLPRILNHERRHIQDLCTALEVCGLSECACPPWKLSSVMASGAPVHWHVLCDDLCGRMTAEVHIPLQVTVCDSRGRSCAGTSILKIETSLPSCFAQPLVLIVPCVQLNGCGCCSDTSCLSASLSVTLDIYRLKLEACSVPSVPPACPQLPLYPPPIRHRCM